MLSRESMTIEQEREFVNKWFEIYEKEGFSKEFWTPYTDYESKKGEPFEVLGRVEEGDVDLECLPQWKIKFNNGEQINAYPEEIIPSEICSNKTNV